MDTFVFPENLAIYAIVIKTVLSILKQYVDPSQTIIKSIALALGLVMSFTLPLDTLILPVTATVAPWLIVFSRVMTGIMTGAGAIGIHELSRNKTTTT